MRRRPFLNLRLLAVGLVFGLTTLFGPAARNAGAQPQFQVVAQGLDNPRGLAFGADGSLYIAEAGKGGAGPCVTGPEGGEVCFGTSGAITRVRSGVQQRITTGLPSYADADGSAATGPHDIALSATGDAYVAVGLGGTPTVRAQYGEAAAAFGHLIRVSQNGQWQPVADLAGYEQANDPGKEGADSNPYSVVVVSDRQVVADAGANALFEVAANGAVSTVAVFPSRLVPAPPIPGLPPQIPMQSVPNSIARGPDGAWYVGELTGFPFQVGGANVYRVEAGKAPAVYATGFTNIIDLTFGPDGSLYVLEIISKGLLQAEGPDGDVSGSLYRIAPGGARTVVASAGLIAPSSVAIGPDGGIYVSNFGILAGAGQVVRVGQTGSTTPLPNTGTEDSVVAFPETGFSMDGAFLSYWQDHGGLAVFGFPIDSARQTNGQVAQWLERARFELNPSGAAPYNVLLGRLGAEALERQGRAWQSFPQASSSAAHYFAETGHAVTFAAFWSYWSSHGLEFDGQAGSSFAESLALFGYPLSEAQMERNASGDIVLTQWFERARLEYHPGNPAAYRVLLGRLGAELQAVKKQ